MVIVVFKALCEHITAVIFETFSVHRQFCFGQQNMNIAYSSLRLHFKKLNTFLFYYY